MRKHLLAAAAVEPSDRVLDIGCGSGQSTCDHVRRATEGHVLGVDLSSRQLALGRERAAAQDLTNVAFQQADL